VHDALLPLLACPACGSRLALRRPRRAGGHVMSGRLACAGCGGVYAVEAGVPRLNVAMETLRDVAGSFSYEWRAQAEGAFEPDRVFGRTQDQHWLDFLRFMGLKKSDVQGAAVLDAGCGPAALTSAIGAAGAAIVVGIDMSDAVDAAFARCRDLDNVDIVQGNILSPPLRPAGFDYVWSMGVIHHTPDPRAALARLAGLVKPGGTLFVWVYSTRPNPFRLGKAIFARLGLDRLPAPALHAAAKALAWASLAGLESYRRLRPAAGRVGALKPRTAGELELTWFDALAPLHASQHGEAEVRGWFDGAGFVDVVAYEDPNVAVRGRAPRARSAVPGLLSK